MKPLNILCIARPDLLTNPGGDTTQIVETRRELEDLGNRVDLLLCGSRDEQDINAAIAASDIVHCFNLLLSYQYERHIAAARALGKRVVLSPVYWDMEEYERAARPVSAWKIAVLTGVRNVRNSSVRAFFSKHLKSPTYNAHYRRYLRGILAQCDAVLPNSDVERDVLFYRFDRIENTFTVRNGCRYNDTPLNGRAPDIRGAVLCVGRIERRKNQRMLIRAMEGLDRKLVLLGNINYAEESYWRECREEAVSRSVRIIHVPGQPWDQVWNWYRLAAVHAQPSWFETPGLSSLEAAANGCPVVCTEVGSAREYFGNYASYCRPHDAASIRRALEAAAGDPPDAEDLRRFIRANYTWRRAAEETRDVYARLLAPGEFSRRKHALAS